jgi:tRNA(Ile2) C34 agmatinyltransferase TiaS
VRGAFEYDEFDDELDDEPEDIPVCPDCGGDDLESLGEDEDGNGAYECLDCGERFVEGEEDA